MILLDKMSVSHRRWGLCLLLLLMACSPNGAAAKRFIVPCETYPGYNIHQFTFNGHTQTLVPSQFSSDFALMPNGMLITARNISHLEDTPIQLVISDEFPTYSQERTIHLHVINSRNKLTFHHDEYDGQVRENSPSGTVVSGLTHLYALPLKDNVRYEFIPSNSTHPFSVESSPNLFEPIKISTTRPIDREYQEVYSVVVHAEDTETHDFSEALVVIKILDENDNPPVFLKKYYYFKVPLNISRFDTVGKVKASDRDGDKVVYEIKEKDEDFVIVPQTGEILFIGQPSLDVVTREFEVIAHDKRVPKLYSTPATVYVKFELPEDMLENEILDDTPSVHVISKRQSRAVRPTKRKEYKETEGAIEGQVVFQLQKESDREYFKIRDSSNPWVTVERNGNVRVKKKWDFEVLGPEKAINFWVEISNAGSGGE